MYAIIQVVSENRDRGRRALIMSPTDWFWKIFEVTGSPDAYLIYRCYMNDPDQVMIG